MNCTQWMKVFALLAAGILAHRLSAQGLDLPDAVLIEAESKLVGSFLEAAESYASGDKSARSDQSVKLWIDGFEKHGVSRSFLQKRFAKAQKRGAGNVNFNKYRTLTIQEFPKHSGQKLPDGGLKSAIHAVKLDVMEDYDDVTNDNVYMYYITTSDDTVWGRVTDTYKGLDEGTAVFLNAQDRGVYGPKGEKLSFPSNHVIVDFGLIESDDEDISQLKKLSDAIVDLALVALTISNPEAGAAAAQARAEVNNLMHLIVELDTDDRLVTDSVYFTPQTMAEKLAEQTYYEFTRVYEQETTWTHYKYGMTFRLIK